MARPSGSNVKRRLRLLIWVAILVGYALLAWRSMPWLRSPTRPTVCWVIGVEELPPECNPPAGLARRVRITLGYDGPPPQLEKIGKLFSGRLICDAREQAVPLDGSDLRQAATLDPRQSRITVELGLHLDQTPSDAGGVALYLTASTPLVVGEPILVPVRLSTDSRGRPLPLGAIQQVDSPSYADGVQFSSDGRLVVLSGDVDGWLCDVVSGATRGLPAVPVAVSHDGMSVALLRKAVVERTTAHPLRLVDIELYDTATGAVRRLPVEAKSNLFDENSFHATFSADNRRLFAMWMRSESGRNPPQSAPVACEYRQWDTKSGALVRRVTIPFGTCHDPLAGKAAALWPRPIGRVHRVFSDHTSDYTWTPCLTAVRQEKDWLLWVDDAGHFRAWDIAGNKQVRDWALDSRLPLALDKDHRSSALDGGYITPDGRLMAVAGGKLMVCNCDDGRCQSLCPVPPRAWMVLDSFRVLGCSRDRGVVALADGMGMGLLLLDTASGETLMAGRHEEYDGQDYASFCGVSFSDGKRMLTLRVFGGGACAPAPATYTPPRFETTIWDLRRLRNAHRQMQGK